MYLLDFNGSEALYLSNDSPVSFFSSTTAFFFFALLSIGVFVKIFRSLFDYLLVDVKGYTFYEIISTVLL